jgi:hypothetical protein
LELDLPFNSIILNEIKTTIDAATSHNAFVEIVVSLISFSIFRKIASLGVALAIPSTLF